MIKKIAICGHFGRGKNLLNGQTIKTKILSTELKKQFQENNIKEIDTHGFVNLLLLFPRLICALVICENILILPAHRGVKLITVWLKFWNFFFRRKLHYVVIGGWLPSYLENHKITARAIKTFTGIYVETNTMKRALENKGFTNIYLMPNCKNLNIVKLEELKQTYCKPYKLCTFSRVMKEKGIGDAIEVVKDINSALGETMYELDIYGSIDVNQTEWFEELQTNFPSYISYKGCVNFDKSVETLNKYFALLFPTYYSGEGFAGTIIDALAAGLPVIASDWKYNAEIVKHGICGYIYPTQDNNALYKILCEVAQNPNKILLLKKNCVDTAKNYLPEQAISLLINNIR